MVNRIVTGAHYGVRDWLAQRLTAVVMAACALFFAAHLWSRLPLDFRQWKALFQPLGIRLLALIFVASLMLHAWVGIRNVLMDYVRSLALRLGLQLLVILALAVQGAWAAQILWSF